MVAEHQVGLLLWPNKTGLRVIWLVHVEAIEPVSVVCREDIKPVGGTSRSIVEPEAYK